MEHPVSTPELVQQIVALRRVLMHVDEAAERRRLARVIRQLRRRLGNAVPKHPAAACLGVSPQALERWVRGGEIPAVRRPGSSRELTDSEALLAIVQEVSQLREVGRARPLSAAIQTLVDQGRMPRRLRPNQPAHELRHEYLHTTPADRMRSGIELSQVGLALAGKARARTKVGA